MENKQSEDRWVAQQLAGLTPSWSADEFRAHARMVTALEAAPSRRWLALPAGAALVCLVLALVPSSRSLAQAVWARWWITRIDVVQVDLSKVPLRMSIRSDGFEATAVDFAEAERRAGFAPYLPGRDVLSSDPTLVVTSPLVVEQSVSVAELETLLQRVGAADLTVPAAWDKAIMRADISAAIVASYPGNIDVVQVKPIALYVPVGFALNDFAEVVFRGAGMPAREAKAAGLEFAISPAWLLYVAAGDKARVSKIPLGGGTAWLFEGAGEKGTEWTVLRTTTERMYVVSSPSKETSIAVAGALR